MSHSCVNSVSYLPNIWCIFMTSQTALTENGLVYTCDCHNYCAAIYWSSCWDEVQGTGWESRLTMFYMVMQDSNGHFYREPVWHPGLLPTPVGRNPMTPPQGITEGRGQGGRMVFFAMGYVNSSGQEITCVYKPFSRPQEYQGTNRHRTALDG